MATRTLHAHSPITRHALWCILIAITFAGCFGLFLPLSARASGKPQLVLLNVATQPSDPTDLNNPAKGVTVNTYFSISPTSENYTPQKTGTLTLTGANAKSYAATIGKPSELVPASKLRILLLLDTSNDMETLMKRVPDKPNVKDKLKEATHNKPSDALIAVGSFNHYEQTQTFTPIGKFTDDPEAINNQGIEDADVVLGQGRCLYNATYKAIEYVHAQAQSQDRTAIIIVTNGTDTSLKHDHGCSDRTAYDVVTHAQEENVPIYPIGLCNTTNDCTNIKPIAGNLDIFDPSNNPEAIKTTVDNVGAAFGNILSRLGNQWVAQTTTYPAAGPNKATLEVTLSDTTATKLDSEVFSFDSQQDYNPPAPAPTFSISTPQPAQDGFTYDITITHPEQVGKVTVEIDDNKAQVKIRTQDIQYFLVQSNKDCPIQTDKCVLHERLSVHGDKPDDSDLQIDGVYIIKLSAVDSKGNPITTGDKKSFVLATTDPFQYDPKISFEITNANYNSTLNEVEVALGNITGIDPTKQSVTLQGEIDDDASHQVFPFHDLAFKEKPQIEHLPLDFQQTNPKTYNLKLSTVVNGKSFEAKPFTFTVQPLTPQNFLPLIILGVLVVLVSIVSVVLMLRRPRRTSVRDLKPLVYTRNTTLFDASKTQKQALPPATTPLPASPKLLTQATVISPLPTGNTSNMAGSQPTQIYKVRRSYWMLEILEGNPPERRVEIPPTPMATQLVLGRAAVGAQPDIAVNHANVSRKHALLAVEGDHLRLTASDAPNGTFIGEKPQRLADNQSVVIRSGDVFWLSLYVVVRAKYIIEE